MGLEIQRADYYYVTVHDRPGETYRSLAQLEGAGVSLRALSMVPVGPEHTQLVLFPENVEALARFGEQAGLTLVGPEHAFLVQGEDRAGVLVSLHARLADAQVNIYAAHGVTAGAQRFGYILYVKSADFERAAEVLGV